MPINQNQFLQMMMAELQNQDPLNPNSRATRVSSSTELAQITSVEQETNTAQSTATTRPGRARRRRSR